MGFRIHFVQRYSAHFFTTLFSFDFFKLLRISSNLSLSLALIRTGIFPFSEICLRLNIRTRYRLMIMIMSLNRLLTIILMLTTLLIRKSQKKQKHQIRKLNRLIKQIQKYILLPMKSLTF